MQKMFFRKVERSTDRKMYACPCYLFVQKYHDMEKFDHKDSFVRLRKEESNRKDEYYGNDLHTLVKRTWARYNKGREFITLHSIKAIS